MAISLIRSLSASVIRNVAGLKRDAKRLQKNSVDVFGTQYPLVTCQRALAVSRGFRSLEEVEKLGSRLGMDRDAPFYTIRSRNDAHESVLNALYRLDLEYAEGKPIVFLGEQRHAILPALVLFLEHMSFRKRPGLLLIETEAASCQDTVVQDAIQRLGVEDILDGFRTLDLRDRNLPLALSTEARCWAGAITSIVHPVAEERLGRNGWSKAFEAHSLADANGRRQIFGSSPFETIPFYSVAEGARAASKEFATKASRQRAAGGNADDTKSEDGGAGEDTDGRTLGHLMDVINELSRREFSVGTSAEHESRWRPYVALFSRFDPASEVLAGVLHSYFYWRNVNARAERQPVLYVSQSGAYAPRFLGFGDHTAVVNGLSEIPTGNGVGELYGYRNALRAVATEEGLQYMGTRVAIA